MDSGIRNMDQLNTIRDVASRPAKLSIQDVPYPS